MSPVHSNPTTSRRDKQKSIRARAPYNFVPLPERIVPAREPLDHDVYHDEGLTGWIECDLQTCSPTYVRGMMTEEQFAKLGNKKSDELKPEEKRELAPFFSVHGDEVEGYPVPAIPGSSLRGMVRALVEIAGFGRIRWVAKEPTVTFRAVVVPTDDPLYYPYRSVIGFSSYKTNVRAGYLEQRGEDWYVRPALTPRAMGWPGNPSFLTIKEQENWPQDIPGYIDLNHDDYYPQAHKISFDIKNISVKRGRRITVNQIGSRQAGYKFEGAMVCSGNMREAGGEEKKKSHRSSQTIVLAPDKNAKPLRIKPQSVQNYLAGMTPFQKEKLRDWGSVNGMGCLKHDAPVFYVVEKNEVVYFGHCPNFRIPALLVGSDRAVTPYDFIPEELRSNPKADLADAIFGWVDDPDVPLKNLSRAGRVSFSDALFVAEEDGVWLRSEPLTPHTLSGPKPTTFQHYLVQDRDAKHDPDAKESLAHFGSDPETTQARGFKLYWHKGESPDLEASSKELKHKDQLTQILPVKPGVSFSFKIHFENLRREELGAIWWALTLPGEDGRTYRHKLGMGKPLGMGAVALSPRLHLTQRLSRYERLFDGESWHEPSKAADGTQYVEAFEKYVLKDHAIAPDKNRLAEVERIRMLLAMLQWREGDPEWLEETRYMEIEHGLEEINEYKERPVLMDPLAVVVSCGMPQERARSVSPADTHSSSYLVAYGAQSGEKRTEEAVSSRLTGYVKNYDHAKGFGFIRREKGKDLFFHRSGLCSPAEKFVRDKKVSFVVGTGMKGRPEAKQVEVQEEN